jgi:hypothetical protein
MVRDDQVEASRRAVSASATARIPVSTVITSRTPSAYAASRARSTAARIPRAAGAAHGTAPRPRASRSLFSAAPRRSCRPRRSRRRASTGSRSAIARSSRSTAVSIPFHAQRIVQVLISGFRNCEMPLRRSRFHAPPATQPEPPAAAPRAPAPRRLQDLVLRCQRCPPLRFAAKKSNPTLRRSASPTVSPSRTLNPLALAEFTR